MPRKRSMIIAIFACAVALGSPAHAAPPEGKGKPDHAGQGNGNGNGKNKGQQSQDNGVSVTLSTAGITVSTARGYAVQAGATGYSSLPPGIRKNLARGKPLPPGIAKKMVPGPMLARLPVHPGYEWRVAGSDLILVAIATAVVADVLTGVFN